MNYLDANHLFKKEDHSLVSKGTEQADMRTPRNEGVSLLAKIIADCLRTGNYVRFDVLSGTLSVITCV